MCFEDVLVRNCVVNHGSRDKFGGEWSLVLLIYWLREQVFPYPYDLSGPQISQAKIERGKKYKCSWHVGWPPLNSFLDLHHSKHSVMDSHSQ